MPDLDPRKEFESLKARTLAALTAQFPITGRTNRIEMLSIQIDERAESPEDPHHIDNLAEQLKAKLRGGSWSLPIKGKLRLVRIADEHVIDTSTVLLAHLPKITSRYSYIVAGHERQHDSLFRSKSRPYHLVANDGSVVARWNVAKGVGFDLIIDPTTGRMQLKYRTSHIPLYPVLNALGVTDDEMRKQWGEKVLVANKARINMVADLGKLHRTATKQERGVYKPPPLADLQAFTRDLFTGTQLRPDGMRAAFGKEFDHVNGEGMMLSTGRILGIASGRQEPDDRQALSAKDFVSTDDFVVEFIEHAGREMAKKIKANLDRKDKVSDIVGGGPFSKAIAGAFEAAQRPEQTNPLTFISGYLRTTIRGAAFGGVKGEQTNLDKDKLINPTHLGFLDPVQTPEGEDTGIALHLPLGVRRAGKELEIEAYDVRSKGMRWVRPGDLERENVTTSDQVEWVGGHPKPRAPFVTCYDKDRRTSSREWKDVRYVLRSSKNLFSMSAIRIPFLQNDQGNRAQFGAKQQEQAISLKHREAPLVQSQSESSETYDGLLGQFASHRAPVDGTVAKIEKDKITLTRTDGKPQVVHVYDHFPLNGGKMMLHAEPVVKVGQRVKKGDLLADTNFTRGGVYADGINTRVAYTPFHGLNFEDGIVASESFAKRATSEHLHVVSAFIAPTMVLDTRRWVDYVNPEKALPARLAKLDAKGVIKEGETVTHGDILIALLAPSGVSKDDEALAQISRKLVRDFKDRSEVWDHDYPGKVVRVVRMPDAITVHVRTEEPLAVGDKLSGRHGNKGIVSRILPDSEMPHTKDGVAMELLLNPAGVPSRMNLGQALESAAGRIAQKTGKPYVTSNFTPGKDYMKDMAEELKKHGLNPDSTEVLYDPATKSAIGPVFVGVQHMLKLHHVVDKKMTALGVGTAFTPHGAPPSGAGVPGGGQKMDQLTTYAMLAHGAKENLREAYTIKSDADQQDMWIALQTGQPLPPPRTRRVVGHFLDYLRGMGIHVNKDAGDKYQMGPLTDKQTKALSNGALKFSDKMLQAKGDRTLTEPGGLFDNRITGGLEGKFWSHIDLHRSIPNPIFEKPICRLLGINEKEFEKLTGPELVNGKSGFEVITSRLAALDVKKELVEAEAALAKQPVGARLDQAYQKVRYLRALQAAGLTPAEAYTNKALPVIPPAIRRVSVGIDGSQIVDDINALYRTIGQVNHQIGIAHKSTPPGEMQKLHSALYASVKSLRVTGADLGEGSLRKHHNGIMEKLVGLGGPKTSFFHQNVMGPRQMLSGRSTIIPKPELNIDEVGLPLPMALEMYKPFVVRNLHVNRGYSPLEAQKMVREKDPLALQALEEEVSTRPILLKRDPALHMFSIMAFQPKITTGKAVGLHPLSCGGFNADFDGDSMALYVPNSPAAVEEAKRMFPSKSLFSPTHGGLMPKPGQDGLVGLFQMVQWGQPLKGPGRPIDDLLKDMMQGKLPPQTVIPGPDGRPTTLGRVALHNALPASMKPHEKLLHDQGLRLDSKGLDAMLTEIGKKDPQGFGPCVDVWKNLGNRFSYLQSASFKLSDFSDGSVMRDDILKPYRLQEAKIRASGGAQAEIDKKVVALYFKAQEELKDKLTAMYKSTRKNSLFNGWIDSGARGSWTQFGQLVSGAVLVTDASNKPVSTPILRSLGEGLGTMDYWTHMHGARKGTLDRASGTADPGALTKDIINTTMPMAVTAEDCGTTTGVLLPVTDKDLEGRFTAGAQSLPDKTTLPNRTLLTADLIRKLQGMHLQSLNVRTTMHCAQVKGVCATCFGHNENGRLHAVGVALGVRAGHALGEPVTQLAMKTFHTGGAASSEEGLMDSFKRAKQLFKVPKVLPGQAVLSTVNGKVDSVVHDPVLGGHEIKVDGVMHYVPAARKVKVSKGDLVTPGHALSSGPSNPVELLKLTKSMSKVREYLASELVGAYQQGGGKVQRRNVETVVRAMTNLTRIDDPGDHKEYTRGDYAPLTEVQHKNLAARAAGLTPIKHTAALKPMTEVPLLQTEDFMARLNYARLETTYLEGAAQGWSSDIHGHPVPGLVHGAQFGHTPGAPVVPQAPSTSRVPTPSAPFAQPLPRGPTPAVHAGWGAPARPMPAARAGSGAAPALPGLKPLWSR